MAVERDERAVYAFCYRNVITRMLLKIGLNGVRFWSLILLLALLNWPTCVLSIEHHFVSSRWGYLELALDG